MTPAGTRGVSLIDDLVREGARKMLAEALQAEVDDYIARHGGERDENGRRQVVRNGSHQPGRRGRPRHGLRRQVRRQSENARARPVTVEALREYLVRWDELKQEFGHAGQHLSCLPDGRPIHPDTITEWFARLNWEAGLRPIRLHDVRHSYATAALRAGVPVKVVSDRLGHSSVSFTQDIYMHVIPGMDEHAAQVAATAILGPAVASVTTAVTIRTDSPLT
ncbi:MAG: integrase family protein [Pseudonocardia sp.]|nr:integrase family protein [Pseudonocardia sp.]